MVGARGGLSGARSRVGGCELTAKGSQSAYLPLSVQCLSGKFDENSDPSPVSPVKNMLG